ncbi:MAG: DUF2089 family protein [Planctomycetota bacterium]
MMGSLSLNPVGPEDRPRLGALEGHPLAQLPREDLDLIVALVLESGSLKGLAKRYGVSYPTIRSRLDGVIRRLSAAVEGRMPSPLQDVLAELVERGQLHGSSAQKILEAARRSAPPAGLGLVEDASHGSLV